MNNAMNHARILIVEDEGIEALDIRRRLVSLGYPTPEIVFSGEDAIKKADELRPDLILMDIMLHGEIDGVTAAEQIHARLDIPIIYLTAYADEDTLKRARITEPYGYIVKPFRDREVHITIDMALYKHEMERMLRESERWLATTIKSIGDAVIATDRNGLIIFMNPVAEHLTGWKLTEVVNRKLTEILHLINSETRQPVEVPLTRVLMDGSTIGLSNHTRLTARDGREIPIDESAAPIKDDKDNIIGAILVFRDVTEREEAEEALRRANDVLEQRVAQRTADLAQTNERLKLEVEQRKQAEIGLEQKNIELENAKLAKDRFLDSMVYELRTVLDTIIGSAGTLLRKELWPLSGYQEKQAHVIRSAAQHLQSLVYYLLDLATIEAGRVEMETEPVDVTNVLREIASTVKPMAQQKGLAFNCGIPEGQVIIRSHRRALNNILLNLADNAIKFTERGSVRLEFAQHKLGDRLRTEISVVDTGIGIPPENQKAIFKGFSQLDDGGTLRPQEGTGLGLHLSQKLAALIGGEISLKSTCGKGSTFTLTLK
ncbi:MAG: PAS domain S-box protein [Chloroflexi bacterium]|nr:PAS domain S-box protein [Chloroflexota bacterium]